MEIKGIIDKLNYENLDLNLYFCRKLNHGKYVSFSPNVDNQIYDDIISLFINYISKYVDYKVVEYSPTGYEDETIEKYNVRCINNYNNIEQSFQKSDNVETEVNPDNCAFYVLEVKSNDELDRFNIKIFRRVTKFKKLYSRGVIAKFSGRTLNKIESKLIGIDGDVDLIVVNEEVIILSHYSLERIFNLDNQFKDVASEFLKQDGLEKIIDNFDSFQEDCLKKSSYKKILTKMSIESINLYNIYNNRDSIKKTIDMFDLDIKYNENPFCLIYESEGQIKNILRILRDSYYVSIINKNIGIDPKIVNTKN